MNNILKYNIYYPSGNTTALVLAKVKDPAIKNEINTKIIKEHPEVEQVGFVYEDEGEFFLEMAGGEFCGNALRSAAYYFLGGKEGDIVIQSSGVTKALRTGIKSGFVYAEMPLLDDYSLSKEQRVFNVVSIKGISHIIVVTDQKFSKKEYLEKAERIIGDYEKNTKDLPVALGIMFVNEMDDNKLSLNPVVKVYAVNTLFYETACGSGSMCIALDKYLKVDGNDVIKLPILQPSGEYIYVSIVKDKINGKLAGFIEGEVKMLGSNFTVKQ
jgi:diaminopimelate epimerase